MKQWTIGALAIAGLTAAIWTGRDTPVAAQAPVIGSVGRFQISAYGYGSGGGRDGGVTGEGAFLLDTTSGEMWKYTGNQVTYFGTPNAPRRDTRVIGGR
jgi:hypothetical protein